MQKQNDSGNLDPAIQAEQRKESNDSRRFL